MTSAFNKKAYREGWKAQTKEWMAHPAYLAHRAAHRAHGPMLGNCPTRSAYETALAAFQAQERDLYKKCGG